MTIRYLHNDLIDFAKWDKCIDNALNGNIFGYSWYLSSACTRWDAIIADDYQAVLPLPLVDKWGFKFISQPVLVSQLSVYFQKTLSETELETFIKYIPDEFKRIQYYFGKYSNYHSGNIYRTYEIDLISKYEKISSNYSASLKDMLLESHDRKISVINGLQVLDVLGLINKSGFSILYPLKKNIENKVLRLLMAQVLRNNTGELVGIYNEYHEIIAAFFFASSHQKIHLVFAIYNRYAKKHSLHLTAIDYIMKKYAERNATLCIYDDKTTDYRMFGCSVYENPIVNINRLPWYLNWLKS
jgi:hypothetical protein